jgi:hypothetical protein
MYSRLFLQQIVHVQCNIQLTSPRAKMLVLIIFLTSIYVKASLITRTYYALGKFFSTAFNVLMWRFHLVFAINVCVF